MDSIALGGWVALDAHALAHQGRELWADIVGSGEADAGPADDTPVVANGAVGWRRMEDFADGEGEVA